MEMEIELGDATGEFVSGSDVSDYSQTDEEIESQSKLQLAHLIAHVDAPLTEEEIAVRNLRKLHSPDTTTVHYVILSTDVQVSVETLESYDETLLSEEAIQTIFYGKSGMAALLTRALGEHAYVVALTGPRHQSLSEGRLGFLQVTPSVYEVLNSMNIGFGMVVHFPDDSIKKVPLEWHASEHGDGVILGYDEKDGEEPLIVVTSCEDDLLKFDLHFMKGGVFIEQFLIMHASMCVGKYGSAVEINRGSIYRAVQRLFKKKNHSAYDLFLGVDQEMAELIGLEITGPTACHDEIAPIPGEFGDMQGSSSRAHALHYSTRTDIQMSKMMLRDASQNMLPTAKGYRTTDGWVKWQRNKNLNNNVTYRSGKLRCAMNVNVDDSIYNTIRDTYTSTKEALRARSWKHVLVSQNRIIQKSCPVPDNGYVTNDETYVHAVEAYKEKYRQESFDPDAVQRASYFTIHRHRELFDKGALPNIIIPDDMLQYFSEDYTKALMSKQNIEVHQRVADNVIDAVLDEEQVNGIPRTVLLKNWALECPGNFVEDSLALMLDSDINSVIWKRHRAEHIATQAKNSAHREQTRAPLLYRLFTGGLAGLCMKS